MSFINANKTKLLGLGVALVGYFQLPANAELLASLMGPTANSLVIMGLGALAVVFGFLNNPTKPE